MKSAPDPKHIMPCPTDYTTFLFFFVYKDIYIYIFCALPIALLVLGRGHSPYIQSGGCCFFLFSACFKNICASSQEKSCWWPAQLGNCCSCTYCSYCGGHPSTFARILVGWEAWCITKFHLCLLRLVFAFNCCIKNTPTRTATALYLWPLAYQSTLFLLFLFARFLCPMKTLTTCGRGRQFGYFMYALELIRLTLLAQAIKMI